MAKTEDVSRFESAASRASCEIFIIQIPTATAWRVDRNGDVELIRKPIVYRCICNTAMRLRENASRVQQPRC